MKFLNLKKKKGKINFAHKRETGEQAERDWGIMILGFSAAILLVIVLEGYLFVRINRGDLFAPTAESLTQSETINRKTLLDTAEFFEARQKKYEVFRSTATPQIDPSI